MSRSKHPRDRINLPINISLSRKFSPQQKRFLAYLIRRYRGDSHQLGKLYFNNETKTPLYKRFEALVARAGLLPFLRGVQLVYGSRYSDGRATYPAYVYEFRDHGRQEIRFYPSVADFDDLEPEYLDDDN